MKIIKFVLILILITGINMIFAQTSFNVSNKTTGDTLLTISNNGRIGIGTTTPVVTIDVKSDVVEHATSLCLGNSDDSHWLQLYSGRGGTSPLSPLMLWQEGDPMRFASWGATYNEYMRLSAEGNLGIGTTTPTTKLEVADTIYSTVGGFKFPDGSIQATAAGAGSGNTLDQAYDQDGAGVGRTITADAGAFEVNGFDGVVFTGAFGSGTIPIEGEGTRMMWYPRRSAIRAGSLSAVVSNYWDADSIGPASVAMGASPKARGIGSTAFGYFPKAEANYSTAFGYYTTASGWYSTAMGAVTRASGEYSTALGYNTRATGDYSFAMGSLIEARGDYSVAIALSDQTGVIVTQDNTMAIMGGKVGIDEIAPTAELQVGGTDGVLFTGTYGSGTIPTEGSGTRMMWYPGKAAFRAGRIYLAGDLYWNDDSLGTSSFATGFNTRAIGSYSTAMGHTTRAGGDYSVAMGTGSVANGTCAFAHGHNSAAEGYGSIAIGAGNNAINRNSTAIGISTITNGDYSTAIGAYSRTAGNYSIALGTSNDSDGNYSVTLGYDCEASGDYSTALGFWTFADGIGSMSMGHGTRAMGDYSTAIGNGVYVAGDYSVAIALSDQSGVFLNQDSTLNILGGKVGIEKEYPAAELHIGGTDGLVVEGSFGDGIIPAEGAGTRMMWYPAKAAFRAGYVDGIQWDDVNIGDYSIAMGYGSIASNLYSTAMGAASTASGHASTAMGRSADATGTASVALGDYTEASGSASTALGRSTIASGGYSSAMGAYINTSGTGSFAIGDYSTTSAPTFTTNNRFYARFANGYRLYTNSALTSGAEMLAGANSWSTISDSTKKENFKSVDGEDFLNKISNFNLTSWNYIGQDPANFRHYGPMAQDFYAAFGNDGIGTIGNDTTIASADFDGINFIAIQALEKRTRELKEMIICNQKLENKVSKLEQRNENLNNKLGQLENRLQNFEKKLAQFQLSEKVLSVNKNPDN